MCFHPQFTVVFVLAELFGLALVFNVLGFRDRVATWHGLLRHKPRALSIYGVVFCVGVVALNLPSWSRC
jgi:hypothetical protein